MTIGGMVSWIFLDKLMYEDAFFLFVLMNKVNPFVLIICTYVQNIDFDLLLFQAWDNHLKRNQSVVVDLFQGQVKIQSFLSIVISPFLLVELLYILPQSVILNSLYIWTILVLYQISNYESHISDCKWLICSSSLKSGVWSVAMSVLGLTHSLSSPCLSLWTTRYMLKL